MPRIIAIDIGTTHCKAVTVDEKGKVIKSLQASNQSVHATPGQHEQDAIKLFDTVIQLLLQSFQLNAGTVIACVSFSVAMHGIMAVDISGKPLTNIITWADTRSAVYARQLLSKEIAKKIYQDTGTPIHAMSPLCKLIWMRNELPDIFNKAYKFISFKEYLFYRLFGKYVIDVSVASATGLFDIYQTQWSEDALQEAGIGREQLSVPVKVTHAETMLVPEYMALFKTSGDIPFIIGANDGCLANLGCGAVTDKQLALTIGTSGAVRLVIPQPYAAGMNTLFNYILSDGLFVTGGPTNNGGNILQWFADNILKNGAGVSSVIQLAETVPAGAEGLLFLPYLFGERAPVWDATATGAFIGLQARHQRAHMARAIMEGVCYALYDIFCSMHELTHKVDTIYASGGFTKSFFWVQMIADVFGKRVAITESADASALGAAIIGMYATGIIDDLTAISFINTSRVFEYNEAEHILYHERYKKYAAVYNAVRCFSS